MAEMLAGTKHHLILDTRKHAIIKGVVEVCSFQETEIVLQVDSGTMVITGDQLHVSKLVLEQGEVNVTGRIDSVHYETPRRMRKFLRFKNKS